MLMHYANGREAKVGDLVVGYGYNTPERIVPYGSTEPASPPKRVVGVLVKAVPGSERCNAEIEWVESIELDPAKTFHARPGMAQGEPRMYTEALGDGKVRQRAHYVCRDYTHCGGLLHVDDVFALERLADGSFKPITGVVTDKPV
jgi:hypothetical protein